MGAYRVLSPQEQRVGGQGVVQFMRWARTEEPVAVKFFLSQATFDEEMQLYAEESLCSMMPVMREAMRAGQVRRSSGYVFPAFAVLERARVCRIGGGTFCRRRPPWWMCMPFLRACTPAD